MKLLERMLISVISLSILYTAGCKEERNGAAQTNSSDSYSTEVLYKVHGLNFSPYLNGQDPTEGISLTKKEIKERMAIIAPYTKWIRTFGVSNGLEYCGQIAHELGIKAAIGAWLDSNHETNMKEINDLIKIAKEGHANIIIVGSEVLHRKDLDEDELLTYIDAVKREMSGIPIAYADTYFEIISHSKIVDACDIILINYYPFWEGISLEKSIQYIHGLHQYLKEKIAGGKQIIISEVGWPSNGQKVGEAIPSSENAALFFLNFVSWARENDVSYWYFEAFDEEWKGKYEGELGKHWGVFNDSLFIKNGMEKVFNDETMDDNWSNGYIPGISGEQPIIEFTSHPEYGNYGYLKGQVWHVKPEDFKIAVFIRVDGGWWTKPYWVSPLTNIYKDGSFSTNTTTGGNDHFADKIVAFLVPADNEAPLMDGDSKLPKELEENAIANLEIERAQ